MGFPEGWPWRWEHRYLGVERLPNALSALGIEQFFTLGGAELAEVRRRRGSMNRPSVALQIGFLKMIGTLLNSVQLIPAAVHDHLGGQLWSGEGTPRIASIRASYRCRRTLFDHQQAALSALGFRVGRDGLGFRRPTSSVASARPRRGDIAFGAGDALGKLLRTLHLCDYLRNPTFRTEILDLLNRDEFVHSLERAIHTRGIGTKCGRTPEQMAAISGALLLLASIMMA